MSSESTEFNMLVCVWAGPFGGGCPDMSRNEPKISSHKGCSQHATERRRGVSLVRQLILFSDGSAEVRFLEAFLMELCCFRLCNLTQSCFELLSFYNFGRCGGSFFHRQCISKFLLSFEHAFCVRPGNQASRVYI